MASMFSTVFFVKDNSTSNKYTTSVAIYRAGDDEFIEYKFKAFRMDSSFWILNPPIQDPAITENGQELEHIAEKFNTHSSSTNQLYKKPISNKPNENNIRGPFYTPIIQTNSQQTNIDK
ncbi:6898_t:CDS:2, partial [Racocetra persica]